MDWLTVQRGTAPLIVAFPHGGTDLAGCSFGSEWLARRDTDWWIEEVYDFARDLGATLVSTRISRSVIDANRDPSGASLYPGMATTGLCPETTFDGEPLIPAPLAEDEIARRRATWHAPYHAALAAEMERLRSIHPRVVLYDAHSIRSHVPRLFDGELPLFNIGTNDGRSCAPELETAIATVCAASGESHVVNGRFKGGWTTRHHGNSARGIHAVQMELAMRGYLAEPAEPTAENWPPRPDPQRLAHLQPILKRVLSACLAFAGE